MRLRPIRSIPSPRSSSFVLYQYAHCRYSTTSSSLTGEGPGETRAADPSGSVGPSPSADASPSVIQTSLLLFDTYPHVRHLEQASSISTDDGSPSVFTRTQSEHLVKLVHDLLQEKYPQSIHSLHSMMIFVLNKLPVDRSPCTAPISRDWRQNRNSSVSTVWPWHNWRRRWTACGKQKQPLCNWYVQLFTCWCLYRSMYSWYSWYSMFSVVLVYTGHSTWSGFARTKIPRGFQYSEIRNSIGYASTKDGIERRETGIYQSNRIFYYIFRYVMISSLI